MLSLDSTQLAIVASTYKKVSWLFKVVDNNVPTTYYWSTLTRSYGGQSYTFKVLPKSIRLGLSRNRSEMNVHAPNTLGFSIHNSGNSLTASDFEGGSVELYLVLSDGTDEETIVTLRFSIKQCVGVYQELHFSCVDFLQQYLKGDYPNTKLVKDISPSSDPDISDNMCVPVPFGTCYIPLRSIYETDQRYYLLGPTAGGLTYTITKVHSPRSIGTNAEWDSGSYSFTQSTKIIDSVSWRVFQPIIADSNGDSTPDACGLWLEGEHFLDMPTRFSRSDTVSLTSPADIIEFVLEDMGVPSAEIDTGVGSTFEAAATTYSGWGLTFNGAFFTKQPREQVLALLLTMCHSCLRVTDKIELHVLSKTSQKTITDADVLRKQDTGKGDFSYRPTVNEQQSDSGYIAFQESGEPQDAFNKCMVQAKSSNNHISSEILTIPFVQDSQDAQRIGSLHYQRLLLQKGNADFTSKATLLALQPDDVITVNASQYGGNYSILVDSIGIAHDLALDFGCILFSDTLDDWSDLSPDAIVLVEDDSTSYWAPVICGPQGDASSGYVPSVVPGCLVIGTPPNYILIDPGNVKIESSNYSSGVAGSGFLLSEDLLEVGNIACRGIIRTSVFQKGVLSVISGGIIDTKGGDVLDTDMTALDASTLTIEGNETFTVGDILRIKDGIDDEWLEVTNIGSAPTYSVTRDSASSYAADSNPAWTKGASVTNYGQSGDGGVYITASESNAPYISVFTHAGSPWSSLTTRVRIGNLNGFLGYSSDLYGIAIGETDAYMTYDPTNGLRIKGTISVESMYALPVDTYLAGYWSFDDGTSTTAKDGSGNGNDGTISGALWAIANSEQPVVGDALWFDGVDDKVTLDSTITITGEVSVSFWGMIESFSVNPGICCNGTSYSNGRISFRTVGTDFRIDTQSGNLNQTMTTEAYPTGTLVHIVITRDSSNVWRFYKNGEDITSGTPTLAGTLAINRICDNSDNSSFFAWYGVADEFRIYNGYTLTENEVKALYLYPGGNKGSAALANLGGTLGVARLDSDATDRMFDSSALSDNIQGWPHASDATKIDGGDIYTGSVTAAKITVTDLAALSANCGAITAGTLSSSDWAAAAGIRLDLANRWLKMGGSNVTAAGAAAGVFLGLDTSYKFYVGDGSNNYFKYDGTNVSISTSLSDAVTIKSGGGIKIEGGGDIELVGNDSNPGVIQFVGTSYTMKVGGNAAGTSFSICPATDEVGTLYIGSDGGGVITNKFENVQIYAEETARIGAFQGSGEYAQCLLSSSDGVTVQSTAQLSTSSNSAAFATLLLVADTTTGYGQVVIRASDAAASTNYAELLMQEVSNEAVIRMRFYTTTAFELLESGILNLPLQSGAKAYLSADQSIATGTTWRKVNLDSESYDINGDFDSSTNYRFDVPEDGRYKIAANATIELIGAAITFEMVVYVNGAATTCYGVDRAPTIATELSLGACDTLDLDEGDYIELYVRHNHGSARNLSGATEYETYLTVHKIA